MMEKHPYSKPFDSLSPIGQQRKRDMLGQLQQELMDLNRMKQRRKSALAAVLAVTVLGTSLFLTTPRKRRPVADLHHPTAVPSQRLNLEIRFPELANEQAFSPCSSFVGNQPGVVDRYSIQPGTEIPIQSLQMDTLSNNEMLEMLAEAGQPSFLGEIDGQWVVFPRPVLPASTGN